MQWKLWLRGLISVIVGGAANAVAAVYVVPDTFNFTGDGFSNLLKLAGAGAVIALFAYLKQSPLPPENKTKVGGLVSLLFLSTLVLQVGCHRETAAPRPGSLDAFDSQTYDVLLVSQGVLDQAKIEYTQGVLPTGAKEVINRAGDAYNVARDTWLEYRAVKQAGAEGDKLLNVRAKVDAAVKNLDALIANLRALIKH